MGTGIGETFGATKYLWGNVPAFDVLELGSNEGEEYEGDLRILFAGTYYYLSSLETYLKPKYLFQ